MSTVLHRGEDGERGPLYTRMTRLTSGALLLTAEIYRERGPWGAVFPIWRSDDGGRKWELVSEVADVRFHAGNRYQPIVYELPAPWAGRPAGTLLLAGNAFPADGSETNIVLYESADARTWSFVSVVDTGGPAEYDWRPTSETTAVWEPCLDLVGASLVCFLADERRKADGMLQVITRRASVDGVHWSDAELVSGVGDRFSRPGMFVSTGEMPDGRRRAVIEVVGPREVPIHLLESADGLDWGAPDALGTRLVADDGTAPSGTPNITWRVDEEGRVVVIVTGRLALDAAGEPVDRGLVRIDDGPWRSFALPVPAVRALDEGSGYSQTVLQNADGELVQATTVRGARGSHDIVVGVAPSPW
ncbi:hypothetical protein [Microbacterium sp. NPDC055683]